MIKKPTNFHILFKTYLTPNVDCTNVTIPDTKVKVLNTSLMASVLFAKHIGTLRTKGMVNVPPIIVR